jgi:hypothetical protein
MPYLNFVKYEKCILNLPFNPPLVCILRRRSARVKRRIIADGSTEEGKKYHQINLVLVKTIEFAKL